MNSGYFFCPHVPPKQRKKIMSYYRTNSTGVIVGFLFLAPVTLWICLRVYNDVSFSINCEEHIKRAADANTVDSAKQELTYALKYLEDHKSTEGNTSIFFSSPANDVKFWYENLKSSHEELNKVTTETSQLERTNVLMKLRETLLDHGSQGDSVTKPSGMSVFPHNKTFFYTGAIFTVLAIFGGVVIIISLNP